MGAKLSVAAAGLGACVVAMFLKNRAEKGKCLEDQPPAIQGCPVKSQSDEQVTPSTGCPVTPVKSDEHPAVQGCPFTPEKVQSNEHPAVQRCPFKDIVKATAPAVAPKVREIVDHFYPSMFKNNPEAKAFFNPVNQFQEPPRQRMALANAVVAYASNIDNLGALSGAVKLIAHKHCALNVQSPHYAIVHQNLMASIGHVLGEVVTPEIGEGWSEAVLALAKILITTEEELYQMAEQRSGGWRGQKDFRVASINTVAQDCKEITFVSADVSTAPIDFTPGQFLTVHLKKDGATPRHYTVTSAPCKPYLQCCVKKLPGGFVSGGIHELKEGDLVGLSAPFGLFTLSEKPAVLISAGIGATPMKAFLEANVKKVCLAVHVDKSEATHPFRKAFIDSGVKTYFHYTSTKGRPTMAALVEQVKPHLADCDIYACGPAQFMSEVKTALTEAGASNVNMDVFGPTLA